MILGLFFAFLGFAFQSEAAPKRGIDQDFLAIEGVYSFQNEYVKNEGSKITKLDRLYLARAEAQEQFHVILSYSEYSYPLIVMKNAKWVNREDKNFINLHAEGGDQSGIYGEIKIKIDKKSYEFKAYFTDTLAEGYKVMRGKRLKNLKSVLDLQKEKSTPAEIAGLYRGKFLTNENCTLIVRHFSSGKLGASIRCDNGINHLFQEGEFYEELGIFTFTHSDGQSHSKLTLAAVLVDGKLALKGCWISRVNFSGVEFKKTGEQALPQDWENFFLTQSL